VTDEKAANRLPAAAFFAGGFLAGAFTAYYVLWRSHALVAGHPLAMRPADVAASAPPAPWSVPTPRSSPAPVPTGVAPVTPAPEARDGRR
jgi:hypothetical protein